MTLPLPRFWQDLRSCFRKIDSDSEVRAVVLTGGDSRIFTAGLDLKEAMMSGASAQEEEDVGRRSFKMYEHIRLPQEAVSAVEECKKPVVIALHNAVIGGGIDLACACDIRYCTEDAFFSIAEVKVGLAADVGKIRCGVCMGFGSVVMWGCRDVAEVAEDCW